ncbi:unnamed protein product [Effrenium voratum]|nr:unnamed protein product [Effrenium voratum]
MLIHAKSIGHHLASCSRAASPCDCMEDDGHWLHQPATPEDTAAAVVDALRHLLSVLGAVLASEPGLQAAKETPLSSALCLRWERASRGCGLARRRKSGTQRSRSDGSAGCWRSLKAPVQASDRSPVPRRKPWQGVRGVLCVGCTACFASSS